MLHFDLPTLKTPACLETFDGHVMKLPHSHNEVLCVCSVSRHVQLLVTLWTVALPGSSVHGILQARMLERISLPSSRGSSQPRDQTWVFGIAGRFCTPEPPGKPCNGVKWSKVAQLCPTLCDPVDCKPRLLRPWGSPSKNTGVGYHFLLQGIFSTQGSNPGLPHCRQTL